MRLLARTLVLAATSWAFIGWDCGSASDDGGGSGPQPPQGPPGSILDFDAQAIPPPDARPVDAGKASTSVGAAGRPAAPPAGGGVAGRRVVPCRRAAPVDLRWEAAVEAPAAARRARAARESASPAARASRSLAARSDRPSAQRPSDARRRRAAKAFRARATANSRASRAT